MKTHLRNLAAILAFASISIFSACTVDDGIFDDLNDVENTWEFIDQNVQGSIDGETFTLGMGSAEDSFFEEGELSIDFYHADEDITDPCDVFGFGDFVSAFFDVPSAVGLYELALDFNNTENNRTVTLFNPANTLNIIASSGAIEILTISDTEITGRIHAYTDEDSINGNFTVTFCPE